MTGMTRSSDRHPIFREQCVIASPIGKLGITTQLVDGSLMISEISYLPKGVRAIFPQNDLAREAKVQLEAYFDNPFFRFNLPLKPQGTPFQNRVWTAIGEIEAGKTASYGALAKQDQEWVTCRWRGMWRKLLPACNTLPSSFVSEWLRRIYAARRCNR